VRSLLMTGQPGVKWTRPQLWRAIRLLAIADSNEGVPYDVFLWSVFRGDEAALRSMKESALIHIVLQELQPDLMVPHMFCAEGMTRYRSLFDLMQIPFVGNHDEAVWPSTDKATTKHILGAAGVGVPRGDLLEKGKVERPTTAKLPFVVKACNEDNSRGLSLVRREDTTEQELKDSTRNVHLLESRMGLLVLWRVMMTKLNRKENTATLKLM